MARNIGPDMLANLEARLASGAISPAEYEARKAEVLELIRRGKAVELSAVEKGVRWGLIGLAVVLVVVALAGAAQGADGFFGLSLVIAAALLLVSRFVGRRR